MQCNNCNINISSQKILENNERYSIKSNKCSKCNNYVCCMNCLDNMKKHFKNCLHKRKKTNIQHFFVVNNNNIKPIDYDYVVLPKELGGTRLDISTAMYYDNYKELTFIDSDFILHIKKDGCYWMKK